MALQSTLHSLIHQLPETEQYRTVLTIVNSLDLNASLFDIQAVEALIRSWPTGDIDKRFQRYLQSLLEHGRVQIVQEFCLVNEPLRISLLEHISGVLLQIVDPASILETALTETSIVSNRLDHLLIAQDIPRTTSATTIVSYLNLVQRLVPSTIPTHLLAPLSDVGVALLKFKDAAIALAASRCLLAFALNHAWSASFDTLSIWNAIQELIAPGSGESSNNLGYTTWLQLASSRRVSLLTWITPIYWSALRQGLRHSDPERTKQCLAIIRASLPTARTDESVCKSLCSRAHVAQGTRPRCCRDHFSSKTLTWSRASPKSVISQHELYLTVFETIILGRYTNQIIECEPDLHALAAIDSLLEPEWLYVLFERAMRGNSRKYIGGWIMRDKYLPIIDSDFVKFLETVVLPWALSGTAFATTVRKEAGIQVCVHGVKLANYVAFLLQATANCVKVCQQLIDVLLDALIARFSNTFAYTAVYILEGLSRALDQDPNIPFSLKHIHQLKKLATWTNLADVARDYVLTRSCQLWSRIMSADDSDSEETATGTERWDILRTKIGAQQTTHYTIASWNSQTSARDHLEMGTLRKCQDLTHLLDTDPSDQALLDLETTLLDLWGDVEYQEYPKQILLVLPDVLLHARLVAHGLRSPTLGETIAKIFTGLKDLCCNRPYLFPRVVLAMNRAIFANRGAITLLSLEDFVLHFIENLPSPNVDLMLEEATTFLLQDISPECSNYGYEHYFGLRLADGIAALIDMMSRVGHICEATATSIFKSVLTRWARQQPPLATVSPWKSAVALQIMLVIGEHVFGTVSTAAAGDILQSLLYIVSIEPLPHFRFILVWIISRIYEKHAPLKDTILDNLRTTEHHTNPKYLSALMRIAVAVARNPQSEELFAHRVAVACLPLACSPKIVIRHESQRQIPFLMQHAREMRWTSLLEDPGLIAVEKHVLDLDISKSPPLERRIDEFDPAIHHNLTFLTEGCWFHLDNVERPFCGRVEFESVCHEYVAHKLADLPARSMELGQSLSGEVYEMLRNRTLTQTANPTTEVQTTPKPSHIDESRALQTKGTAYLSSQDADDDSNPRARGREIIIIASLVDNPYNLGGISRAAEIFGAKEMHLQNQHVTSSKDFLSVAVSSHLHLPILQLSEALIPALCSEKREEGYIIVGMEQTNRSVLLGSGACIIPDKMVLIIGSEKAGIPATLLAECDLLLEIPQQGVTRSLNVQTATAIVLYEYIRQHGY